MQRIQPALGELRTAFAALSQAAKVTTGCGVLILACAFCSLGIVAAPKGTSTTPASADVTQAVTQATATTRGPTATPAPPTATIVHTWNTLKHFEGSASTQTENFTVSGQWRIVWKCTKSNDFGGTFSVISYTSDGSYDNLIANASDNNGATFNGHQDGTYYLKVDTYNENWTIDVEVYS